MSHVTTVKAEIHDIKALAAACAELGLTFKENQQTYKWWGTSVGNYPLPEGFTVEDLGKCQHAIGVPGTEWEIGVAQPRNGKGYRLLFDFYGNRGEPILNAIGGQQASKLVQLYAVHKATLEAEKRGLLVQRKTVPGTQKIQLVCTGM